MAEYKCNNCGATFYVNEGQKPPIDASRACPTCKSTWTTYIRAGMGPFYEPEKPVPKEEEKSG